MLLFWSLLLDNFFQQCTAKKLISVCVAVEKTTSSPKGST
ncbi:hypothetical protein BN137_1680 [Cronobacter condimenti 1330]|uniref:Uncharacterized protein n=1 Tax=Cronobacter condimenti 1330 TaxID=1073999 RepID=K8A0K7_9ENTR|nr:hypothetical protein BN137_1680 [Cronobacter condimenti 1330]